MVICHGFPVPVAPARAVDSRLVKKGCTVAGTLFSGSSAIDKLAEAFRPVVRQFDRMLEESATKSPELAALWLLKPSRLTKLYQLRCLVGVMACGHQEQVGD